MLSYDRLNSLVENLFDAAYRAAEETDRLRRDGCGADAAELAVKARRWFEAAEAHAGRAGTGVWEARPARVFTELTRPAARDGVSQRRFFHRLTSGLSGFWAMRR